jgi:hypothetical protein
MSVSLLLPSLFSLWLRSKFLLSYAFILLYSCSSTRSCLTQSYSRYYNYSLLSLTVESCLTQSYCIGIFLFMLGFQGGDLTKKEMMNQTTTKGDEKGQRTEYQKRKIGFVGTLQPRPALYLYSIWSGDQKWSPRTDRVTVTLCERVLSALYRYFPIHVRVPGGFWPWSWNPMAKK